MWFSFIPAALGAGVMQINLLVDLVLASFQQQVRFPGYIMQTG